jgi:hypothetical protein
MCLIYIALAILAIIFLACFATLTRILYLISKVARRDL